MGQEIVLFHSALGLRPAVRGFADRLRAAGHVVHTPDLFEGAVFDSLDEGILRRDEIGMETLIGRAQAAVAELPGELVYAGSSMGSAAAELLAATRPGARAAVLMHGAFDPGAFGLGPWLSGVPLQVHHAIHDPDAEVGEIRALEAAVRAVGAPVTVFAYEAGGHLFEDGAWEGHDARSAALMPERVLAFLASLG
jgi:dienelactone hydrolase